MKLGLALEESRMTADSSDVVIPLVLKLQSFESWQDLENVKIISNLEAHIFRSDYAIVTELAPKWSPFPRTLGWSPYCWWHPIQIWSNPALKLTIVVKDVKTGENWIACISSTKKTVVIALAPKWYISCVLSDDIHIVGDIPYKFGAEQVWIRLCLCNIKICDK